MLKIYKKTKLSDVFNDEIETIEDKPDLTELYDQYDINSPEVGDKVEATFIGYKGDDILFDCSYKDYIRVENKQIELKYLVNSEIGDKIDLLITNISKTKFLIKGSINALYESRAHETLKLLREGESVKSYVKELTPAGYNIDIYYNGVTLPGFMPNTLAGINKLFNIESIVGLTFDVMIESFSKDIGTYIVSRRKYLQTLIPKEISKLETNKVYTGNVTGSTPFGVFVEFNECLTGMIHKTNLHPDWQDKITQISPGYEIDFFIKEIIKDKIILTQIQRDSLWDNIEIGQVYSGTVKDNKQFGTLVFLDNETVGLIKLSEVEKLNKPLIPGNKISVRISNIDKTNRKIFLSLN